MYNRWQNLEGDLERSVTFANITKKRGFLGAAGNGSRGTEARKEGITAGAMSQSSAMDSWVGRTQE